MATLSVIHNPAMKVWCQCCQRRVDFFEANFDIVWYRWELHITCHGKNERQTLDQMQIEDSNSTSTTVFAFAEDAARMRELERNRSRRVMCL